MLCAQLTELKALLGCVGQVKFVMGCISQLTDGRYFLEDMSDSLPIDLSDAQTTSGFFTGDFQPPVPLPLLHKRLRSDSDAGSPGACTHCLREAAHPGAEGAVWNFQPESQTWAWAAYGASGCISVCSVGDLGWISQEFSPVLSEIMTLCKR